MTLDELKSSLWGAAVLLRGKINATGYKEYIFPLVFFKRISDVHEEEYKKALELSGGDEEFASDKENYTFVIPEKCFWEDIREVTENVGQALVTAWTRIEQANPDKVIGDRVVEGLGGIFGKRDHWTNKNLLPDKTLSELIEHFSKIDLSIASCPADEMGNAYEYLVGKFADDAGNTAQEFYTNRTVVELMAEILEPKAGESIYDPTCGTGGMLISCIARCKTRGSTAPHPENWREIKAYGQEQNALTSSVARMNLFLHGVEEFRIINDDTLLRPGFLEAGNLKTFDVVLANPPYSIKQWNREFFANDPYGRNFLGVPPQGRADYAFIQHIFKSMDPKTGRCAILLPHGVLFREEEKHIRKALIENDLIEAVIGLAPNLFYNSPMEACVMVCRTNKPTEAKGRILFINAVGEVTRKNAESKLEPGHIEKILKAYHERTSDGVFAYDATIEEIAAKDWSLAISLYAHVRAGSCGGAESRSLEDALIHQMLSAEETENQLGQLESAIIHGEFFEACIDPLIPKVNIPHRGEGMKVRFGDVVREVKEKIDRDNNPYEYYVAGDHMDSEDLKIRRRGRFETDDVGPAFIRVFKPGQVLYGSRRTYLKKVCYADFAGITANTTFVLETKDENVLLQRLLPFLMLGDRFSEWSIKHSKGSTNPYILFGDLANYEFNLPPIERQRELADLLWAANDLKESYKKAISATDEMLKAKFREMFGESKYNTKVSLGDICSSIVRGPYGSALKVSFFVPKSTPNSVKVYEQKNAIQCDATLGEYYISKERYKALTRFKCCPGDFIMSCAGTVGCVYQLPAEAEPGIINQALCKFTLNEKMLPVAFLVFMQNMVSSLDTKGSAMKNLCAVGILKNMPIYLPPLSLQREFVAIAEKADAAKSALKQSIADIDQVMKGLINHR